MSQVNATMMSRILPPSRIPSTILSVRLPVFPLTVPEQREAEYQQRLRDQKKVAEQMKCCKPTIFTAAAVESMSTTEIAKLLNDCYYDLVRTEKRLLTDPDYDEYRKQSRR